MTDNRLFWIDLETTGLDAQGDVPIEMAWGLTDEWGNNLKWQEALVYEPTTRYGLAITRGKRHEIVGPMHEASGLWKDLERCEAYPDVEHSRAMIDEHLVGWLEGNGVEPQTMPLCGNSVGSLDRPFMILHFPKTHDYLSHRQIDISSFKETCRRVNPELFDRLRPVAETKEAATHRALDDLRASIVEYQAYLDNFFFTSRGD
jgi:oligoribonuclease